MGGSLYILLAGFLLFILFKFAKQVFFKILFFIVLIGAGIFALYYFQIGPFKENITHIEVLKEQYCETQTPEICDCIVSKLDRDITSRFNNEELAEMKEDRIESAYVFQKSLSNISSEAKACLKEKNKEELWSFFIKETLHLNNDVTTKLEELFEDGKTAVDQKINDSQQKKQLIDDRYED